MSDNKISKGSIVKISKEGFKHGSIESHVEKVLSDDRFLIETPIYDGLIVKLSVDSVYEFTFDSGELVISYIGKFIKNLTDGKKFYSLIEIRKGEKDFRRRAHFRFNCNIPISFDLLDEDGFSKRTIEIDRDLILSRGIVNNISAGGSQFYSDEIINNGDKIKILIKLNDIEMVVFAQVVFCEESDRKGIKNKYRCKFIKVEQRDSDQIIKYIFEEQRKKIKDRIKGN